MDELIKEIKGLSEKEAQDRLTSDGYNELPSEKPRNVWHVLKSVLSEPMFLLLLACAGLYFLLSDIKEALTLAASLFVIIGITFYQENKTEKALAELKKLSSPRALVIRDGEQKRIAGREVVVDDIIIIAEGDRVPADAVIISATNLTVDESLLTGESVPVDKTVSGDDSQENELSKNNSTLVFSSTLVVKGRALVRVLKIGANTEIGKIGRALETIEPEKTVLQKQTSRLVKGFAWYGIILCFLVAVIYAITRQDIINGLLAGVALAMSVLPEEFPVIMTIFLALGAWQMSRHNVLARRIPAIENLGAITALCVDKTGTLTQNKMTVSAGWINGKIVNFDSNNLTAESKKLIQ